MSDSHYKHTHLKRFILAYSKHNFTDWLKLAQFWARVKCSSSQEKISRLLGKKKGGIFLYIPDSGINNCVLYLFSCVGTQALRHRQQSFVVMTMPSVTWNVISRTRQNLQGFFPLIFYAGFERKSVKILWIGFN